jgi:beta-glucuronidase
MNLARRHLLFAGAAVAGLAGLPLRAQPAAPVAPAAPPFLLSALASRRRVPLDGLWHWIVDPFDVARRKPRNRRAVWKDEREVPGGPLIEYEWETSPTIRLPGDWNSRIPELGLYDGPAFFRRLFTAAPTPGHRQFLAFEAVNRHATVWLNGEQVGTHEGGFTPFVIEVSGRLTAGQNLIVVRADSRHGPQTIPSVDFDWLNYGGITRSAWLVETPAITIRDHWVRLQGNRIVADVALDGAGAAGQEVTLRIPVLGIRARATTDAAGVARFDAAPRGLQRWTPDAPRLYDVEVAAGTDRIAERIGFCSIETRGRELLLNGEPVFIRGIALHEEALGATASRTVTEAQARALLATAKELGCNFVRLAHYPHGETMLRLADEMGLMVWAEIPVYWEDIDYADPRTLAAARTMMAEMVLRDRNRAAIILWSVANETPRTPERTRFLETLIADVRALDPTRLLTAALDKNPDIGGVKDGESRILVSDPLGASLDVIAVNQYEAWYSSRTPDRIADVSFSTSFDKPLLFSEFGADALYGHRGPKEARWTEDYQAWLYEETLKLVARTPGCIGCTPWLLKDFRSPRRWHGRFQAGWNRKGLVSEEGHRKLAFETLRHFYMKQSGGKT